MRFILKIIIFVLNLIFALMKLLPVQNKVTFISRQSDDKSEDMELVEAELIKRAPQIKLVFLCKKLEGNPAHKAAYCFHVARQMYHIATSKAVVLDSYCIAVSVLKQRKSLVVIQMWHALGALKRFGLSIVGEDEGSSRALAESMAMHKNYTCVLASGRACAPHFAQAFGYDEDSIRVMTLPRVDRLTDPEFARQTAARVRREYPQLENKKVVVYAPTFRKGRDISADVNGLAEKFDGDEYIFVLKKHPLMKEKCDGCLTDEKFSTLEMLFAADYVVCDYSAVIFEAAILKKPMFFYAFDYDAYGAARDFYIDYMKEMPGVISADPSDIAEAIKKDDYDLARIDEFSHKFVEKQENCAADLAEMIIEMTAK